MEMPFFRRMRGRLWIQRGAASVLALAVIAAYSNSFHGPFVMDDPKSIPQNPTIFRLWPLWRPLSPPGGSGLTVEGRPLLNLSFALNYAIGRVRVSDYHLTNLLIHLGASLLVLGICRRILKNEPVAFAMALLWAIHPLQTESVTYIVQRAESLMGLFYLATVYAFMRAVRLGEPEVKDSETSRRWCWVSVGCCLLGMAVKEVMASAPLAVLLIDRTLVAGSFREAITRRRAYYGGLVATWALLGWLVVHSSGRGGTVGMAIGISPVLYWKTQPYAIAHYLYLFAYPRKLVFDYGTPWISVFNASVIYHYVLTGALILATLWGLIEGSIVGLLGFWFFAILAPTSLVPGNRQVLAEHRVYVALVPVVLAFGWVLVGFRPRWRVAGVGVALLVCVAFGVRTYLRNDIYRTELSLFGDSAAKMPNNAFAQEGYGAVLTNAGQDDEAEKHLKRAIVMAPHYGSSYGNLGAIYLRQHRIKEAISYLKTSVDKDPSLTEVHNNLGSAYAMDRRLDLAIREFEIAVDQAPLNTTNRINYARALVENGQAVEGFRQFRVAVAGEPQNPLVHLSFADALGRSGHDGEAAREYEEGLRLLPNNARGQLSYGRVLVRLKRLPEALTQLRSAVMGMPASAEAHTDLALALGRAGAGEDEASELVLALKLDPSYDPAKKAYEQLKSAK